MGDRYRDYIKGRKRFSNRVRPAADKEAASARAAAIREQRRRFEASKAQYTMRMWTYEPEK